jgi:methyl-accepting chemotaxis protein
MSVSKESIGDPFLTHLVALLSICELGPRTNAVVLPYTGPSTWAHDAILRSIAAISSRMYTAEAKLEDARNTDPDARAPSSDTGLNTALPAPAASDSSAALPYTGPDSKLPEPVPPVASLKTSPLARDQGVEESVGELARLQIQVQDVARVCRAVACGDLTQEITADIEGGVMGELKGSINTIVTKLSRVASEVSRVALEVGTKGILGGEAVVPDVEGTWADLTDSVNVSSRVISLVLAQLTSI